MNTAQHQVGPDTWATCALFSKRLAERKKKTKKTKFNPKTEIGLTHWGKTKGSIKPQVEVYPRLRAACRSAQLGRQSHHGAGKLSRWLSVMAHGGNDQYFLVLEVLSI